VSVKPRAMWFFERGAESNKKVTAIRRGSALFTVLYSPDAGAWNEVVVKVFLLLVRDRFAFDPGSVRF